MDVSGEITFQYLCIISPFHVPCISRQIQGSLLIGLSVTFCHALWKTVGIFQTVKQIQNITLPRYCLLLLSGIIDFYGPMLKDQRHIIIGLPVLKILTLPEPFFHAIPVLFAYYLAWWWHFQMTPALIKLYISSYSSFPDFMCFVNLNWQNWLTALNGFLV